MIQYMCINIHEIKNINKVLTRNEFGYIILKNKEVNKINSMKRKSK